jgi:hypothetical protein
LGLAAFTDADIKNNLIHAVLGDSEDDEDDEDGEGSSP